MKVHDPDTGLAWMECDRCERTSARTTKGLGYVWSMAKLMGWCLWRQDRFYGHLCPLCNGNLRERKSGGGN